MSDEHARPDETLARLAKRGDTQAYDELVRRYLRPAMGLACQFSRTLEDAEDIVQEAFHRAVRGLHRYDENRSFGAWFYTIVRNVAKTTIEKSARRRALVPITPLSHETSASSSSTDLELERAVERAVRMLSPMQEACIRLCDVEGFTSVEASGMLGVTEGTVRTHLHRARERLRIAMRPQQSLES